MKTMLAMFVMTTAGCAATQEFFGATPTECQTKSQEIVRQIEKATVQMCQSQQDWKSKALILDAAIEATSK